MNGFREERSRAGGLATLPRGGVAQLGERLVCNQEAIGSIPFTSTILRSKSEGGLKFFDLGVKYCAPAL